MFQIIPAIDLIEGKCVRLTQGDYGQKTIYNENPLEVAKQFEAAGLQRLHLVDLDGAKAKQVVNWRVLDRIASQTTLHIDFGGGVQSDQDLQKVFDHGAQQVTGGSVAVRNPELFLGWLERWGNQRIILGADAHHEKIAISGWQEGTNKWVYDFITEYVAQGVQFVISTDVSKDGLLQGPSFDLYQKIQAQNPQTHLIASGGVSQMSDIEQLADMQLFGVIVGKAIYEGKVSLHDLEKWIVQ
jgi:phosphoribosylformimino-5-aminoimidazole carboxamide ribotide isomerase